MINEFDTGLYQQWRENRFNAIIKHYGKDFFANKKVLELGAGNGDLGQRFHELGAHVTCAEGRESNVKVLKQKYPHLESHIVNLDDPGEFPYNKYDVVLHIGLLYHLFNMEWNLKIFLGVCDHMILETEVMVSDRSGYFVTTEDPENMTSSLDGVATRPTPPYLEKIIKDKGFEVEHPEDPKSINTGPWKYDWNPDIHGLVPGARVMWYLRKKND